MSEATIELLYGGADQRNKKMIDKTRTRAALIEQIKNAILHCKGIQERIAADAAKPVISSRDDGVRYDPAWQDDVLRGMKKGLP